MTSSVHPHAPASGARPTPRLVPKAATDDYIDEVTARLDGAMNATTTAQGEVADAVTAQLATLNAATLNAATPTERVALALPSFEVLNAAPARELIAPAPTPRALLTTTPAEV
uniref:hypothetical protein n=1 Tax=Kribbia dieselivorans TaxID=331526 RepID=UPI0012EE4D4C